MTGTNNEPLKPRRGKKSTMNGTKSSTLLKQGEVFIEYPDGGVGTGHSKIKIGDGSTTYANLPYALGDTVNESMEYTEDGATTPTDAVTNMASGRTLSSLLGSIRTALKLLARNATQAVSGLMSASDKKKLDGIESGAQKNTIVGVKGDAETSYRTGNVNVTKANIGLGNVDNTADASKNVKSAINASTADYAKVSAQATSDASGNVITSTYATKGELNGHVASTNNPHKVTKAQIGLGNVDNTADVNKTVKSAINAGTADYAKKAGSSDNATNATNASTATYAKSSAQASKLATARTITLGGAVASTATSFDGTTNITIPVTSVKAENISGVIGIEHLPQGALERLVVVADDTARFKLTSAQVQLGDTVKVTSTNMMYYVIDESKLSSEAGYSVYTASTATSVPWSGVTGRPVNATQSKDGFMSSVDKQKLDNIASYKVNNASTADYAKNADIAISSTKATNDASNQNIANTYVKNVTYSGHTVTITKGNGATSSFNTADNDTTYDNFKGATSSANGGSGLVPAPTTAQVGYYLRSDGTWHNPVDVKVNNSSRADNATNAGTASYATSVPWSGVNGKPNIITQVYSEEDDPTSIVGQVAQNGDIWVGGATSGSDVPVTQTDVQRIDAKIEGQDTVTSFTIPTTDWDSGTDGSASVYVYSISLNNVYVNVPDVWYAGNSSAMSLAYSKLYKVTVDKDAKKLKLYSVAVPGSSYVISVRGVN